MSAIGTKRTSLFAPVIECYKFVCRSYQPGDRIYGFGFSRGAYTIRVALRFILLQGLVKYENNEAELHRYAITAYRAFRKEQVASLWHIELMRRIRDFILRTPYEKLKELKVTVSEICFVGLWDTVAAYGLPVEEMTRFYSKWIFPFEILDPQLHPDVKRACHVLSIDDERTTFHPVLWTETKSDTHVDGELRAIRIRSGSAKSGFQGCIPMSVAAIRMILLAHVSLDWMMKEASLCDLRFKKAPNAEPDALLLTKSARDNDGRLYDSRKGSAPTIGTGQETSSNYATTLTEKIRPTVSTLNCPKFTIPSSSASRLAHPYAPIGLPTNYAVVTEDQKILAGQHSGYETPGQAKRRFKHQDRIWDGVWKRRLAYFGTIIASAFLFLYPLFHQTPSFAEYSSHLRPFSDLIRLAGSFIPTDFANFWIDEYARNPSWFLSGLAALILFLVLNSRMGSKIADDMRGIWKASLSNQLGEYAEKTWAFSIRTNAFYKWLHRFLQVRVLPVGSAIVFGYMLITVASHLSFNFFDAAGRVCVEASNEKELLKLAPGKYAEVVFDPSNLCQSTKVLLERNGRYHIQFDGTASFRDGSIEASKGFSSSDLKDWSQRAMMTLAVPLRREWLRPWFRVVARFGGSGSEEAFLDPDLNDVHIVDEVVRATRDGELFLFVNDAVIGIPGLFGVFYHNNSGTAKVKIIRRL